MTVRLRHRTAAASVITHVSLAAAGPAVHPARDAADRTASVQCTIPTAYDADRYHVEAYSGAGTAPCTCTLAKSRAPVDRELDAGAGPLAAGANRSGIAPRVRSCP